MKYLFKQSFTSFLKTKSNIIILFALVTLTSFMYFFVQFSVDENMSTLNSMIQLGQTLTDNQEKFLAALQSNTILARSFLIILILITGFIFYMFYKRYFTLHKKEIGCFKALGYTDQTICFLFISFTFLISIVGSLLGMILGWFGSDLLLTASIEAYSVENVKKGIHLFSFLLGVVSVVIVLCVITFWACYPFYNKETALLLNGSDKQKENRLAEKLANIVPKRYKLSVRIAMRKPITILLTVITVGIVTSLFVISISLNLSSKKVYTSQTEGHRYSFDTKYDEYQTDDESNYEVSYYLRTPIAIEIESKQEVVQQIVGMDGPVHLLELKNEQGTSLTIPTDNQVLINPALKELYGFHKGDKINFTISGQRQTAIILDIAENAETNSIYISKKQVAEWLGIPKNVHTGVLSTEPLNMHSGKTITMTDRLIELDKNAVSNRMSGVINQVLGCIIGCLLIYLVLLLHFQEKIKDILVLDLLGYQTKKINKMLINIYRPILCFSFIVTLFPSIWISQLIQKGLSIQTGDYMPFQTNAITILIILLILNVIYTCVQMIFNLKIKKIINQEQITNYI
ncbi:ABC transporter permease [Paenibacillus sp. N3/727]|uniref:ABC transporter permease n=1 Tax=Paenibacillus sp. N3/727 TaxID=2925845 RepID=UPI001F52DFF8|nr:ABC transporter permease [Paenibacillus sp. N3/727]UNK17309.1 ABC transporter permease [Paenibacillus sp. N3/727]